jgi:hypothetical protein
VHSPLHPCTLHCIRALSTAFLHSPRDVMHFSERCDTALGPWPHALSWMACGRCVGAGVLHSLGDARCRFGPLNPDVAATVTHSGESARCVSPPHWQQLTSGAQSVHVQLTLNGQDWLACCPNDLTAQSHRVTFAYYARDATSDARHSSVTVVRLQPVGGPEAGGTLVTVTGTSLRDRRGALMTSAAAVQQQQSGLSCQFGGAPSWTTHSARNPNVFGTVCSRDSCT